MDRIISALYPEEGGPCLGYCCRILINRHEYCECKALFKTERGAWKHAQLAHGIEREPTLETKANYMEEHGPQGATYSVPKIDENKT